MLATKWTDSLDEERGAARSQRRAEEDAAASINPSLSLESFGGTAIVKK